MDTKIITKNVCTVEIIGNRLEIKPENQKRCWDSIEFFEVMQSLETNFPDYIFSIQQIGPSSFTFKAKEKH